jgi:hypothetical protein
MARTARSLVRSAATVTGAVAAVAGVSLAGMPAAGAATAQPFYMYDVNRDGWIDGSATDTLGNGILDTNLVIANGALLWLYDNNENGRPDSYGSDNNGDGYADLWGYDPNEDFVVDSWTYDSRVFSAQPTTFVVSVTVLQQSRPYA